MTFSGPSVSCTKMTLLAASAPSLENGMRLMLNLCRNYKLDVLVHQVTCLPHLGLEQTVELEYWAHLMYRQHESTSSNCFAQKLLSWTGHSLEQFHQTALKSRTTPAVQDKAMQYYIDIQVLLSVAAPAVLKTTGTYTSRESTGLQSQALWQQDCQSRRNSGLQSPHTAFPQAALGS